MTEFLLNLPNKPNYFIIFRLVVPTIIFSTKIKQGRLELIIAKTERHIIFNANKNIQGIIETIKNTKNTNIELYSS